MGDCSTDERVTLEAGEIHLASVYVRPGRRAVRPDRVQSLAESIRDIGLQNPIVIRADGRLISGAHRLEAYRVLGRTTIPCRVAPMDGELWEQALRDGNTHLIDELQEIDENLQREDLTALEQGEVIARRKTIYETLHPETKHGAVGRGGKSGHYGHSSAPRFSEDTARQSGLAERTIRRSAQIGSMPAEVRDAVRNTPLADNQQELLKLAREAKRDPAQAVRIAEAARDTQAKRVTDALVVMRGERDQALAENAAQIPAGKYGVIYADPPWRYDFAASNNRAIENQYPTMTVEELAALPVSDAADENCVLYLWATNPKLREALAIIDAWGFTYKTNLVWVKDRVGMGYWARQRHELLLVATKGNPSVPHESLRPDSVIEAPRSQHSAKPTEAAEIIERCFPHAPKVELFCRTPRAGWAVFGNEVHE